MRIMVIAPHPDDEVLGCAGTLLKYLDQGATIGWVIVTSVSREAGWSEKKVSERKIEIDKVRSSLGIGAEDLFELDFPAAKLDTVPLADLVSGISAAFAKFQPQEVFVPHPGDVHSDHRVCFDAAMACTKWFRYPFVRKVLAYETLSETDANLLGNQSFFPTVFHDISQTLERKWALMQIYKTEIGDFPFPRSELALKSLAHLRGSQAGYVAAEAFCLLRERIDAELCSDERGAGHL